MAVRPERLNNLELAPGIAVGKFEIMRKLAVGGMAEIYLARVRGQAGFEKLVVLKRILPHIAQDPAFVQMFLDEARLAATLQHPNIADVYEVGEVAGEVFFTMEYVHGQDVRGIRWAARKRDEPIPLAIALAIVHGTAAALDYAHDKRGPDGQPLGLVHRDVSSSNVMISYDGAIKLLDFGIARSSNSANKTQTGTLKGKIPYMSPEQCRGHKLDRRSDLFSLGSLMFEVTVGRRPFRGQSDFEVMEQIVHHGAPRPTTLVNGYPPELEAIVMKLLATKPDDRYQTAEELLHDLEPFLAQHRLWASSKPIGKYMRLVFADRITAWEQAQQQGISLVQHVVAMPEQEISEVQTPPSAFPGLVPLSQEMPAVMRPSSELPIQRTGSQQQRMDANPLDHLIDEELDDINAGGTAATRTLKPAGVPAPLPRNSRPSAPPLPPSVPPRPVSELSDVPQLAPSGRRLGFIIGGIAVGVIGIVVVLLLSTGGGDKAAGAAEPTTDVKPETAVEAKTVKPDESKPVETKPVETKPVDARGDAKLVETKPVDPKPVESKPVETKPTNVGTRPTNTGTKPNTGTGTKPNTGTGTKPNTGTGTKPNTGTGTKPKQDPNWDPNSPFLPPGSN